MTGADQSFTFLFLSVGLSFCHGHGIPSKRFSTNAHSPMRWYVAPLCNLLLRWLCQPFLSPLDGHHYHHNHERNYVLENGSHTTYGEQQNTPAIDQTLTKVPVLQPVLRCFDLDPSYSPITDTPCTMQTSTLSLHRGWRRTAEEGTCASYNDNFNSKHDGAGLSREMKECRPINRCSW